LGVFGWSMVEVVRIGCFWLEFSEIQLINKLKYMAGAVLWYY